LLVFKKLRYKKGYINKKRARAAEIFKKKKDNIKKNKKLLKYNKE
jgi:hypothetical protein